jgi:hypothetical protein
MYFKYLCFFVVGYNIKPVLLSHVYIEINQRREKRESERREGRIEDRGEEKVPINGT